MTTNLNIHHVTSIRQETRRNKDYIVTTFIITTTGDPFEITVFHEMKDTV